MVNAEMARSPRDTRRESILSELIDGFSKLYGVEATQLDTRAPFIEMGADSFFMLRASQTIQTRFGIKVPFRMMFEELSTVEALTNYIIERLPTESVAAPASSQSIKAESTTPNGSRPSGVLSPAGPITQEHTPAPFGAPPADAGTAQASANATAPSPVTNAERKPAQASGLERVIAQQIQLMAQQLELLRQSRAPAGSPRPVSRVQVDQAEVNQVYVQPQADALTVAANAPSENPSAAGTNDADDKIDTSRFIPYQAATAARSPVPGLLPQQRRHIEELIPRLSSRTQGSKNITQRQRLRLANNRASAGFNTQWKEMQYPLVVDRASGSRLWDVDGNEYVDVTMGFGALLYGHSPAFMTDAVKEQLDLGFQLGGESEAAGFAAELICELTGVERATFCNSGTEAVMGALRLARTVTGRSKVALFEGCYHGTFDGVMVRRDWTAAGELRAAPAAPGVPQNMIDDVILLNFTDPASLEKLRACAHELAAVLIEPLPSRFPDLKPGAFLKELRKITQESGAALIFDEVVTGFRFHPGGAQELFGVQADLVAYGKAVGAGLPVAVVAGKAKYLDAIDGGFWSYGDNSYPRAETTFFAGTFFKHPLIMAGVLASLSHLKAQGSELQERLNQRTTRMVKRLNEFFAEQQVPFRAVNFGSLFRFLYPAQMKLLEVFYYHLLAKGVYICETRTCYLSTAHTDEDVEHIIQAVEQTIAQMREGGFFDTPPDFPGGRPRKPRAAVEASGPPEESGAPQGHQVDAAHALPLTGAQKELWVIAQMGEDASRAYNESMTLHLKGELRLSEIRNAIEKVVERHEALRTVFSRDGERQLILPRMQIDVPLADFSRLDGEAQRQEVDEWLAGQASAPFDLAQGPLLRAAIAKLGGQYYLLALTMHHIITDGLSNGVLQQEISAIYSANCQGMALQLPEPTQFSQYIQWQACHQQDEESLEAKAYWINQFSGPAPTLDLPTDRPRPPVRTFAGDREALLVDAATSEELRRVSAQHGSTMFVMLLSAFSVLLHRLSGQDEIVVGVAVAGQPGLNAKNLIGYCVNLLPILSKIRGAETFTHHLSSVRQTLFRSYEYQHYPFHEMVRALNLPRDASRPPLVSVLFNMDRVAASVRKLPGLEVEVYPNPNNGAKFEIYLDIAETNSGLQLNCDYNTDLYDGVTIRSWLEGFERLLKAVIARPEQNISDLPILTDQQASFLLDDLNNTFAIYPRNSCAHELFEERARKSPDAIAVIADGRRVSYRELDERANGLAQLLLDMGAGPEKCVGVCLNRSIEMVVALLGVLKSGSAYIPLDPAMPDQRLTHVLQQGESGLLLTEKGLSDRFKGQGARIVCLDECLIAKKRESPETQGLPANIAYTIFTSGSTGTPKGVQVPHHALTNFLCSMQNELDLSEQDRLLAVTTISFDIAALEIYLPLLAGACIVMASSQAASDPAQLQMLLEESGATVMQATPATWHMLIESGWRADNPIKIICGGEALSRKLASQLLECSGQVWNMYGPTETTIWSAADRIESRDGPITIGSPIANTQLYVLDSSLQPVARGVRGDLFIGGEGLARGYVKSPDLTASKFIPHLFSKQPGARVYATGDVARHLADGKIEFLGRNDHQVKIRGYRVELGEIEAALRQHPAVRDVVVHQWKGAPQSQRLVAYILPAEPDPPTVNSLRAILRERLPEYMLPSAWVVVEAFPLTANGKVDRKALPMPEKDRLRVAQEFVPPTTWQEKALAEIWSEVLGVDKVGAHDNFFELGGDSILSIDIVAKAARAGLSITPRLIFQHQTIAELASIASQALSHELPTAPDSGPVPMTPIIHWFTRLGLLNPSHFNQALLLELDRPLDARLLAQAASLLLDRHDSLRLRLTFDRPEPSLSVEPPGQTAALETVDLLAADEDERGALLRQACQRAQQGLDITSGPTMRLVAFDMGAGRAGRLLVVVHHIAVDIVSWATLLDELWLAYTQLEAGQEVELPALGTSYRQWAEGLHSYAGGAELAKEAGYWEAVGQPGEFVAENSGGRNLVASASSVVSELNEEETARLLTDVVKGYRAQAGEVLVMSVGAALCRWSGRGSVVIEVEGHGREEVMGDEQMGRSVGWFTSIYPVEVDLGEGEWPRG